jgi:hypothetical protein
MKPVAYAMFRDGEYYDAIHPDEQAKTVGEYDIPLYTHLTDLTDEEIKALWKPMPDTKTYDSDILKFARAILRKVKNDQK